MINDKVIDGQRSILTFSSLCPSWVWWSCLLAGPGTAGVQLLFSSAWRCSARHQEPSFYLPAFSSHPGAAFSDGQTSHAAKYEDQMVNGQIASLFRWRNNMALHCVILSCSYFNELILFLPKTFQGLLIRWVDAKYIPTYLSNTILSIKQSLFDRILLKMVWCRNTYGKQWDFLCTPLLKFS